MTLILFFFFHFIGLAAAIANMKHEEDMRMSVSPPITANDHAALYARLFAGGNMLSSEFLAKSAMMTAHLPMQVRQSLAAISPFYSHHPASLFGAWTPPTPTTSTSNASPPISPISPMHTGGLSVKSVKKINNNNNNNHQSTNNNNIVSTTTGSLPKKARKPKSVAVKKDMKTPNHEKPMGHLLHDHLVSPTGPISPPTSGSSPQSNGSIDHPPTPMLSSSIKDPNVVRDKQFTCTICARSFGYKHVLQNHERTHTGEKPFECPECHKRFTRDHHLKTHMRLHTGEKPYHCDHCDRHFVQVANLRRHMRVHTGEKPYKCEICKSTFADSNQLKGHKAVHTDEKPFQCDRCHEKFRRRHHFNSHKCGVSGSGQSHHHHHNQSELRMTPVSAMSPTMSSLSDHKSDASDLSMDLSRTAIMPNFGGSVLQSPMDMCGPDTAHEMDKRNSRKSLDVRRILRMPPLMPQAHFSTAVAHIPEQTEPEDLSMHSPRSNISHDEDLDELDDAATLYMKQKRALFMQQHGLAPP